MLQCFQIFIDTQTALLLLFSATFFFYACRITESSESNDAESIPNSGTKRLETRCEIDDEALQAKIADFMVEFGMSCSIPDLMNFNDTEESLLQPTEDAAEFQTVVNIAIEDDETEWRPMQVNVMRREKRMVVNLSLSKSVAPIITTAACEHQCKIAMRMAFLKEITNK